MKHGILVLVVAVAGCTAVSRTEAPSPAAAKGGYYKDDGPGANPPADLAAIPDAVPKAEPLSRFANRPYQALGREYVPMTSLAPFRQSGIGSWYGRRYHGQKTSSGEPYDMYAMSAAHPTLPIPSYARVTNLANGRSVVVRVNDRGPFHADRIIDLSYTAAWKLGYVDAGSARLEVESLLPGQPAPAAAVTAAAAPAPLPAPVPAEAKGIYLQLGAFSSPQGAESLRERLGRELGWLSEAIKIVPGGALYRLHVGPYRSQDDARPVADRIYAELSLRPLIVSR
jgi:rare lipoprotein A